LKINSQNHSLISDKSFTPARQCDSETATAAVSAVARRARWFRSLKDVVIRGQYATVKSTLSTLANTGRLALGYAGLQVWNSYLDYSRHSDLSLEKFKRQLKMFLFVHY